MISNELLVSDNYYIPDLVSPGLIQLSFQFLAGTWIPNSDNGLCYPGVSITETAGGSNVWRVNGIPYDYARMRIRAKSVDIPNASASTFQSVTQDATEHSLGRLAFSFRDVAATGAVLAPPSGIVFNLLLWCGA